MVGWTLGKWTGVCGGGGGVSDHLKIVLFGFDCAIYKI